MSTRYAQTSNVLILLAPYEERIVGVGVQGFGEAARLELALAAASEMPWFLKVQFKLYLKWKRRQTIWRFRWRRFKESFA